MTNRKAREEMNLEDIEKISREVREALYENEIYKRAKYSDLHLDQLIALYEKQGFEWVTNVSLNDLSELIKGLHSRGFHTKTAPARYFDIEINMPVRLPEMVGLYKKAMEEN